MKRLVSTRARKSAPSWALLRRVNLTAWFLQGWPTAVVKKVADAELVAVASRSEEGAASYAAKNGIPYAYGTYDGLLESRSIDCVYIPLPVSMHAEWAIKALEAGKHVMCEKPLTANAEEAEAIRKTVKKTKRTFIEAFHYRYHPLMLRVGELVRSGAKAVQESGGRKLSMIRRGARIRSQPRALNWRAISGEQACSTGCDAL